MPSFRSLIKVCEITIDGLVSSHLFFVSVRAPLSSLQSVRRGKIRKMRGRVSRLTILMVMYSRRAILEELFDVLGGVEEKEGKKIVG